MPNSETPCGEPDPRRYREELDYLIEYARGDWVNFLPVEGAARVLVGARASDECHQRMVVRLVGDMFDAGIRPIDLTPPPGPPFVVWPTDRQQTLERVHREMAARDHSVDYIDICWFTAV